MSEKTQKAVIYCRVSSKKQTADTSGLHSQEYRCREFANERGYEVEAVFPDDVSGGGDFMKRPGMVALLAYLDAFPQHDYVVIFDDLKRYARDAEFHLKLRREMMARNARRECLNFNFENTPEGKFIETVLAAQGELERTQNRRQVMQKMTARVEQGFWVFRAPVGYKYVKSSQGGKVLVRDEPIASILQEGLEGFASGRFATQTELKRFLERHAEYPKDLPNGELRPYTITRLLNKAVYAGYVEAKEWNVSLRKGKHEGLISFETFQKIQHNLETGGYAPTRKDISEDFALRGFVACGNCGQNFKTVWSKGKYKKYPYYRCDNKKCGSYGKSIPRAKIEGEFEEVVRSLQPSKNLIVLARAMFKHAWDMRSEQLQENKLALKKEIHSVNKQTESLLERIMEASNPTVIRAYEDKITQLEKNKLVLAEKLQNGEPKKGTYEQFMELSMKFLANPYNIWASGNFKLKRLVLRLGFADKISYTRNEGYGTPKTSLPFKVLGDISARKETMVLPERFELSTSPLPRECSTPELRQHRLGTSFWSTQRRQNKCFGT